MWTQNDAGDLVIALCYAIDAGAKPEDILATIQGVFDDKAEAFAQAGKWDACKPFADMSRDLAEVQRLRLENGRLRAEKERDGKDINLMADEIKRLGKENCELKCRRIGPISP